MANKTWLGNGTASSANYGDWSQADNWSPSGVPVASDNVRFTAEHTTAVTGGLNQSAVTLGDLIIETGYKGKIGTNTASLQVGCASFEYSGSATAAFIDLGSSAIGPVIHNTGAAGVGQVALEIKGSAFTTVTVMGGNVGLATKHGDTASATNVRVINGSIAIGSGATVTNLHVFQGTAVTASDITDCNLHGGTVTFKEQANATTVDLEGGICNYDAEGTITTANCNGGKLNVGAGQAKTITTLNLEPGGSIRYYPSNLTITNNSVATNPIDITTNNA